MAHCVALVAYETPAAPCGGIAAVLGRLPKYIEKVTARAAVVISPFHHRIERTASLLPKMQKVGEVGVPSGRNMVMVDILRIDQDVPYYFLKAVDARYFAGVKHPYDIDGPSLLRDSLFFGAAVARALRVLSPQEPWLVALQDWETATTALALAGQNLPHRLFVTLHNSYDCDVLDSDLDRVAIDSDRCPGTSILDRAFRLAEHSVFTVSGQFARDLTSDILQREIMAPHLQQHLGGRLIGVNNGPFIDCAVPRDLLGDAQAGIIEPLKEWKKDRRQAAHKALQALVPSEPEPIWGDPKQFPCDDAPWFVMAGRDDSRQKGYDVAAAAIEHFLFTGGNARFLFFPIPGDEGVGGLGFLRRLAERYPDSVLALPFRFRTGYFAALQGANFGIMPSLYEPFGMANEFYLNGTLGIGRATGGIVEQVIPWRSASSFSRAVEFRAEKYHNTSSFPTGILYRERDNLATAAHDWRAFNAARYDATGEGHPDRVSERSAYPLYRSMVEELGLALADGSRLVREQPELYHRMLVEGVGYIERTFSWERAAADYVRNMEK
jgi:glycosyltransferase involved in cell wall biosynthesis